MATLSVRVVAGARVNRIVGKYGDAIKVQVGAPPVQGKANDAVVEMLAGALGVKQQQVRIVRGHSRPRKIVEVDGIEQADAEARLSL